MSRSDRDVTRVVRSWLDEGVTALPDRVLDAVLDQLPATPQRRSWWTAWRRPFMNNTIRIGLAAAAVVVIAIIAIQFFPGSNVGGPPTETPPASTPAPSATSSPSPTPANFGDYPSGIALTPGSYVFTHVEPLLITFTVPSGWEKGGLDWVLFSVENIKAQLAVMSVASLYEDPCGPRLYRYPPVGPTVEDLAAALGTVPGLTFSAPTDVNVAGFDGLKLDYVPPDTFGTCAAGEPWLWRVNQGTTVQPAPGGDDVFTVRILDVNGTRLVITASAPAGIPAGRVAELEAIIDSIQIE